MPQGTDPNPRSKTGGQTKQDLKTQEPTIRSEYRDTKLKIQKKRDPNQPDQKRRIKHFGEI